MRLTGFDFYAGRTPCRRLHLGRRRLARRRASTLPARDLTWQRIASGLFQPLGLKIVDGTGLCLLPRSDRDPARPQRRRRDRLLRMLQQRSSGDGALSRVRHGPANRRGRQLLLRQERHAMPCKAVVPHHGTLLRVSKDGSKTDILATGFRARQRRVRQPGRHVLRDRSGRLLAAEEPHQPRRSAAASTAISGATTM